MHILVPNLTDQQLDAAVAWCRNRLGTYKHRLESADHYYRPCSDWHFCGPLLEELEEHYSGLDDVPNILSAFPKTMQRKTCEIYVTVFSGLAFAIPDQHCTPEQLATRKDANVSGSSHSCLPE